MKQFINQTYKWEHKEKQKTNKNLRQWSIQPIKEWKFGGSFLFEIIKCLRDNTIERKKTMTRQNKRKLKWKTNLMKLLDQQTKIAWIIYKIRDGFNSMQDTLDFYYFTVIYQCLFVFYFKYFKSFFSSFSFCCLFGNKK